MILAAVVWMINFYKLIITQFFIWSVPFQLEDLVGGRYRRVRGVRPGEVMVGIYVPFIIAIVAKCTPLGPFEPVKGMMT